MDLRDYNLFQSRICSICKHNLFTRIKHVITRLILLLLIFGINQWKVFAFEHMYWTDADNNSVATAKVQRANTDGSSIVNLVLPPDVNPRFIALDYSGGYMYWTDVGRIDRAKLDGSAVVSIITDIPGPGPLGVALDLAGGKIYFTDSDNNKIERANLDGTGIEDLVTADPFDPRGLALDLVNGKMYWTGTANKKIQRANLDGTGVEDLVTTGITFPQGIALDIAGGKMYWADTGNIKIANMDGTSVDTLISGLSNPLGIALDLIHSRIYWTDTVADKIQRANLNGTGVEDLVTTGLDTPWGIALVIDTDGDGVEDSVEIAQGRNPSLNEGKVLSAINPLLLEDVDSDGDGISDSIDTDDDNDGIPDTYEIANGLNPLNAGDAQQDNDGDGLTNLEEYTIGSNVNLADSDGDNVDDGVEVALGRDPVVNEGAVVPVLTTILLGE